MKIQIKNKANLLKKIEGAMKETDDYRLFSCIALKGRGVGKYMVEFYWNGLFKIIYYSFSWDTVELRAKKIGYYDNSEQHKQHRLMMLAWFYEMIRSGDWKGIYNEYLKENQ